MDDFKNGKAQEFLFDQSQPFYKLLGKKDTLLRRALRRKNILVDVYPARGGKRVKWVAQGKSKVLVFRSTMPINSSFKAMKITKNKTKTKELLEKHGIKVPAGITIPAQDFDSAIEWFCSLNNRKVVVKPVSGSGGKSITSSITTKDDLIKALKLIYPGRAVLEEHIEGHDHRILVVGGKVVAAMRRWPANVVGDGQSTISQLVEKKNEVRSKNPYDGRCPIQLDRESLLRLKKIGLSPESIPEDGKMVVLKTVANIGAGGDGEDVTDRIHPSFVEIAQKCWGSFEDLECCGVDLMAHDISKPAHSQAHAVIEVNANCDIPIHHWPAIGKPLDVASVIADYYFPDDEVNVGHCAKIRIYGKVQKVGYRRWLSRQALIYGVVGSCRNLEDGTVEAVIEGSQKSVESIIRLCAKGPDKSSPTSIEFEASTAQGRKKFEIL